MEAQKSGSQPPPSPITWSIERKLFFLQAVLGVVTLMAAIAFTLIAYTPKPANIQQPLLQRLQLQHRHHMAAPR